MKRQHFFAMLIAIAGITACVSDPAFSENYNYPISPPEYFLPVTLSVQGDNEGGLREFPLNNDSSHYRAYIQALPNQRYRLRVVNNSDQRVGLVIAVDGRNIISGKKSDLDNNERMYILNPHGSAEYEGWRTGKNQTNRFFFTEAHRSYAAAWGDTSAIGVIAMAVYAERPRPEIYYPNKNIFNRADEARSAAPATVAPAPGTGFGESTYSPSVSVDFEPNSEPMEKIFLKYEWRETLCRKNILPDCRHYDDDNRNNRLWQNDDRHNDRNDREGFALPPPPSQRY